MTFRTLGRTGLRVSAVGLGTWQLGGEWGRDFSQGQADSILDAASESGVNLIDTAECYGDHLAERFIGDYLSRRDRDRWIVATKFGHAFHGFLDRTDKFGPADVREQLEASLQALRTDRVDIYQFHSGTDEEFRNDALWTYLDGEKKAGKIRHLGVSIRSKGSEAQARDAAERGVSVLQVVYNRLDRRPEADVFPHARKYGLGVLARVPLASGLLSGKYKAGARFAGNDYRATIPEAELEYRLEEAERVLRDEVPAGAPPAQWALAWCLREPLVGAVIPGAISPGQVRENAAAADMASPGTSAWDLKVSPARGSSSPSEDR